MTREEAIKAWDKWRKNGHSHSAMPNSMALVMAYLALRGPTREQVEKVWKGEWIDKSILSDTPVECSKCGEWIYGHLQYTNFCPHCGAPMTDEAVEITLRRLEDLDENRTD